MKTFWKAEILQMAESDIVDSNQALITMLQSKIGYDPDLLS